MKTIKLKDILSISGKGGLFRYIAQARNGIVVESIEEGKRHVAPATARVSSLEDIAIFTEEEEVPLSDVFHRIYTSSEGKETLSHKGPTEDLKRFFKELVPGFDEERVYLSDIKKVFQWYNLLHRHDLLEEIEKEEEEEKEKSKVKSQKTKEGEPANPPKPDSKAGESNRARQQAGELAKPPKAESKAGESKAKNPNPGKPKVQGQRTSDSKAGQVRNQKPGNIPRTKAK